MLDILVQMMYLEHHYHPDGNTKILDLVLLSLFHECLWVEFNIWLSEAIELVDISSINTIAKVYIFLSHHREIRLQKLRLGVLEFLKKRTAVVLDGLSKYIYDMKLTKLFVHHLFVMIGVHSESRWMFHEKHGLPLILSAMTRYPKNEKIITLCSHILNFVVEGIVKRRLWTTAARQSAYPIIVKALFDFIGSVEIVSSGCNFVRKVLKLRPEDVGIFKAANCIEALENIKDWYENDGEMHNVSQQVLVTFKRAMKNNNKSKRISKKKSKDKSSVILFRNGSSE